MLTEASAHEQVRANRRHGRQAVADFIDCATRGDAARLRSCLAALQATGTTAAAFRAVTKVEIVPDQIRLAFLSCWIESGDGLRDDVNNDRALVFGLRYLLPRYSGPAITLYRGDSAFNRRRRSYGLSWSSEEAVARSFALGIWRSFHGGSVLLRCNAPSVAILNAVDAGGESEFLVDRRLAGPIEVVERFQQSTRSIEHVTGS